MKVAIFNARATMDQSIRWKRAAEAEGYASVGSWLAYAADAYLRARAKAGKPLPLVWHLGRFRVALEAGEADVRGKVSPPFGVFRGSTYGLTTAHSFSLVHTPTRRIVATFRYGRDCRMLAGEMAFLLIRDEAGALKLAELRERERV